MLLLGLACAAAAGFAVAYLIFRPGASEGLRIAEFEQAKEAELIELEQGHQAALAALQADLDFREAEKLKDERAEVEKLRDQLDAESARLEELKERLAAQESLIAKRDAALAKGENRHAKQSAEIEAKLAEADRALERAAGLSAEEARSELVARHTASARREAGRRLLELEQRVNAEAKARSAMLIATAAARMASDFVAECTVTVVRLPSDDIKGRIIGREGRNIRALEQATGVDFIIDDTPEVVVVSGFDPVRRDIGKRAVLALVEDGRVHPARIEEVVGKLRDELDERLRELGAELAFDAGMSGLAPALIEALGRLHFHTASGQNLAHHAHQTGMMASLMAAELGLDEDLARRIGVLSVVGHVAEHEIEGGSRHAAAELCRRSGEKREVVEALAGIAEGAPPTVIAALVQIATELSVQRPGAQRESFETFVSRQRELEAIARSFDGVEEVFALQAGREVRVMVDFAKLDDGEAILLSREIADRIEGEITFPGEIRVLVVREARASAIAR